MKKNIEADDLKIVEDAIEIRLDNYIYAFSTNTIPNYLKIGDTSKGVKRRIKQWEKILNKRLSPQIVKLTEKYNHSASIKNEEKKLDMYFRDYSVHKYIRDILHKNSIDVTDPDLLKLYSKEFFKDVTVEEVDKAIKLIIKDALSENPDKTYTFYSKKDLDETSKKVEFHWLNDKEWKLRPNQEEVVNNFLSKKSEKELLMYAVMRFGKSFTAMQCALRDNRDKVIIVCAKRDVQNEWKQTIEKPKCFADYAFICDDDLKTGKTINQILKERDKSKYAIFLTLQNISGKSFDGTDIKERLKEIFRQNYDLLIVDETHYGAWAKVYGQSLSDNEDAKTIKKDEEEHKDLVRKAKKIKTKQKLHLSGTPYNLLYDNKFDKNNIIATCQFEDILDGKEKWNQDHMLDIENGVINEETGLPYQEFDNPYFGFPRMLRFAFNLPEEWIQKLKLKKDAKWSLTELFKTKKISGKLKFIYEDEVIKLLKAIDGSSKQRGILGFLDIPKIKDNNVCKHIVMVLPYRSSCDAMEALLIEHRKEFINLCNYENIINITGKNAPRRYSEIENIKKDISKYENEGKKTISLTVHKMLTGVTVKEWDTMIMLKNTKSAQEYDQAIFRIQNQYVTEYIDSDGNIEKKDMKPQTILVDFDPVRLFEIQGLSSRIVDKVINGDVTLEDSIVKELKFFPIITYNANADKLVQVTAKNLIEIITKYNKDKSIIDESNSIDMDRNILNNDYLLKYIEAQSDISLSNKLKEKAYDGSEISDIEEPDNKESNNTFEDSPDTNSSTEKKKNKDQLQRYRMCIACILFYAFLTNSTVGKMEDILKSIEDDSVELERNKRIFNNLKLDKKFIELHIENCSRAYSFNLDNSIKKANLLSKDQSLEIEKRVKNALERFNSFSDSEYVTPIKLCNKLINTLDINYIIDIINSGGRILDIASKTGEFTFAVYSALKDKVDINLLKNAIYSIPTSTMSYEFTRKIYELLELNLDCLSKEINTLNLNEKFDDSINPSEFMKLVFNNKFKEILKRGDNMKFGAVIGNPPYQLTVREASVGNNKNTVDIYQKFQDIALKISDATCLIYPAKEFQRGKKNTLDESLMSLRIFNGSNREGEKHIPGEESVFGDAVRRIPGDVGLVYYNKDKSKQKKLITYQDIDIERTDKILPVIKEFINLANKLEEYIETFKFSNVKKVCESGFVEDHPSSVLKKEVDRTKKAPKGYTKVLTNHKKGSGGKSKWFYIKTEDLDRKPTNEYKLVLPSARLNESFVNSENLEILSKDECFGRSKKCIYDSDNKEKVENCKKYLSTKFAKVINAMTPDNFLYYLPDFNAIYDSIEWPKENDNKAIDKIEKQLYKILKLDKNDIKVIEEFKLN